MNNIDQLSPLVKSKGIVVHNPKPTTVGIVFSELSDENLISDSLSAKSYDGSKKLLCEITREVAVKAANDAAFATNIPTVSHMSKKQKAFAGEWWSYIIDQPDVGTLENLKAYRKTIEYEVKNAFDAVFHKMQTGKDLPVAKDGYSRNAMQTLRRATKNGDAAIILYRIKWWWPKASVILDGKKWIAKTHKQWADELGMEERGFRTAYDRLVKLQLIEAQTAKFNGFTINHIRPTPKAETLFSGETD